MAYCGMHVAIQLVHWGLIACPRNLPSRDRIWKQIWLKIMKLWVLWSLVATITKDSILTSDHSWWVGSYIIHSPGSAYNQYCWRTYIERTGCLSPCVVVHQLACTTRKDKRQVTWSHNSHDYLYVFRIWIKIVKWTPTHIIFGLRDYAW